MIGWLTVDDAGAETCRLLYIPENFVPHVMGALAELTEDYNWEQYGTLTPEECSEIMAAMWENVGECSMVGSIQHFATETLPDDYLPCDGAQYERADYPALYAAISSALIVDAEHFVTPDIINKFVVASGDTFATNDTGGETDHTLIIDEMPIHDHSIPYQACFPYGEIPEICVTGGILTQQTGPAGGDLPHNNMPPYWAGLVGIRCR